MAAVLVTADQQGEPSVVLLGDPGWYAHFGFETAARHGVGSPGPWEERYFQVKRLRAWRPELAGPFRYAPAFDLEGASALRRTVRAGSDLERFPLAGILGSRVWLGPGPGAGIPAARW